MLKLVLCLSCILSLSSLRAQKIEEMNFSQLEPILQKNNDTLYVVNFWATWCKPCVEELPIFIKAANENKNNKVKFIFISLDFTSQKENLLVPFLQKRGITERVILLNDPNSNYWINRVSTQWSGAIPATLIFKGSKRFFYEKSFTYKELINIINTP